MGLRCQYVQLPNYKKQISCNISILRHVGPQSSAIVTPGHHELSEVTTNFKFEEKT